MATAYGTNGGRLAGRGQPGMSVGEIMARNIRGRGNSNAFDPRLGRTLTMQEAEERGPFQIAGYNTRWGSGYNSRPRIGSAAGAYGSSGIPTSARGREERAFRGDMGPRTGPLSPDYGSSFGGLNEFYQNQQTLGAWDRLQGNMMMDSGGDLSGQGGDAIASRMAQQLRSAELRGDYETAAQFSAALNDRMAQRMAAQQPGGFQSSQIPIEMPGSSQIGGPIDGGFRSTQLPMEPTPAAPPMPTVPPISNSGMSEVEPRPLGQRAPMSIGQARPLGQPPERPMTDAALSPIEMETPYGTASVEYSEAPVLGPVGTFHNQQGYIAPGGVNMPSYGGVTRGKDFFQDAADRQRMGNKFAQPSEGYGGNSSLGDYAQRLMKAKQRLRG